MRNEFPENVGSCNNYFTNESQEKRTEEFTRLWVNIINQRESDKANAYQVNMILQSKIS
ncbi:MAG: hypothetical protein ACI4VG_06415 [Lachnospiraceae bacterium]